MPNVTLARLGWRGSRGGPAFSLPGSVPGGQLGACFPPHGFPPALPSAAGEAGHSDCARFPPQAAPGLLAWQKAEALSPLLFLATPVPVSRPHSCPLGSLLVRLVVGSGMLPSPVVEGEKWHHLCSWFLPAGREGDGLCHLATHRRAGGCVLVPLQSGRRPSLCSFLARK